MFRKYEKTYRITSSNIQLKGKFHLCKADQIKLLTGKIEITEKMDGANVAIIRGKGDKWTLQKRRGLADTGVHEQFAFFWNWARWNEEKILRIPNGWKVYGELMYSEHNIHYNILPSYFLAYDVWDGKKYLRAEERTEYVWDKWELQHVPILHYGNSKINVDDFMNKKSWYSTKSLAEGIVVKNYRKQMRGKLVRPKFTKDLDENDHWLHQATRRNKLAEGVEWHE